MTRRNMPHIAVCRFLYPILAARLQTPHWPEAMKALQERLRTTREIHLPQGNWHGNPFFPGGRPELGSLQQASGTFPDGGTVFPLRY